MVVAPPVARRQPEAKRGGGPAVATKVVGGADQAGASRRRPSQLSAARPNVSNSAWTRPFLSGKPDPPHQVPCQFSNGWPPAPGSRPTGGGATKAAGRRRRRRSF